MYIGRNSISCLYAFLAGWFYHNEEIIIDGNLMEEFQKWIADKYNVVSSQSWDRIILFYSQDECDALVEFFKLFNKFLEEKNI